MPRSSTRCKPGILLNTSRAEVVDAQALLERLDAGELSAGLDVFPDEPGSGTAEWRSPLAAHPRVVGTHHIGASTQQAQEAVTDGVEEVIDAFTRGELLHVVERPSPAGGPPGGPAGGTERGGPVNRVRNFCAGPCTLPVEVLAETRDELLDYDGSGMSLIEMSHRSPEYDAVHGDALERLRRALEVPPEFDVLFVQGGALLQFAMVPMNLLPPGSTAGYVRSGAWGKAAHADAERAASVYLAWDGTDSRFTRMPEPDQIEVRPGTRYVHLTSNETIEGIQLRSLPDLGVPLVVDISSDFLTRPSTGSGSISRTAAYRRTSDPLGSPSW